MDSILVDKSRSTDVLAASRWNYRLRELSDFAEQPDPDSTVGQPFRTFFKSKNLFFWPCDGLHPLYYSRFPMRSCNDVAVIAINILIVVAVQDMLPKTSQ